MRIEEKDRSRESSPRLQTRYIIHKLLINKRINIYNGKKFVGFRSYPNMSVINQVNLFIRKQGLGCVEGENVEERKIEE